VDTLTLRRANVSRKGGSWQHEDYDVFDGFREIGCLRGGSFLLANTKTIRMLSARRIFG
jgi:hypothetical protein